MNRFHNPAAAPAAQSRPAYLWAALARGDRVELREFGAFTVKRRNARDGRNPRTGEEVPVKEKTVPFFKVGKELHDRLNRKPSRPASADPP